MSGPYSSEVSVEAGSGVADAVAPGASGLAVRVGRGVGVRGVAVAGTGVTVADFAQSVGQVSEVSSTGSQTPSPHFDTTLVGRVAGQSAGQVSEVSGSTHWPSP